MARYRKIDPRIWNDAKFSALSSEGKLLFLYLLTAPAMTMIGAMPMRASAVAEELGFDSKRYAIRYQELSQMGIVEYDDRGLFWVKNFLKYNAPDNPKVVISWGNVLDLLPECPLLKKVLKSAQNHCLQRGEGYAEAFKKSFGNGMAYGMPNPMPYQEQEQEQEQEQKKPVERVNPVNTTGGDFCPTVDDFGAAPEAVPEPPQAVTGTGVTRVTTYPFPDSLPEDWGIAAAKQRPDVSAEAVFLKLRDRLRERYPGEKRTMAMWLRQFLQWIATERVIGKPLGREETPEEKQKSIENAERFAAAMRKRLEEANK